MEEVEEDEAESLEMSQIIWDTTPILEDPSRPDSSAAQEQNTKVLLGLHPVLVRAPSTRATSIREAVRPPS